MLALQVFPCAVSRIAVIQTNRGYFNMNDEATRLLAELVRWTKVTSYKQVKATLEEALARDDDRIIYHLSDGKRTGVEISQTSGISPATISTTQGALAKLGLLEKPIGAKAYEK